MRNPKNSRRTMPDHVPGAIEKAAAEIYYERGSKEAVERNRWALVGILGIMLSVLMLIALISMIITQKIYVFQADKDPSGRLSMSEVTSSFKADEDTQMAWASNWAAHLTEITPALWQRNVKLVQSKAVGVSQDQIKAYLQQADNNPAQLVHRFPTYVREYKRGSVNKVAAMTYLIRYDLVSRPAAGVDPSRKSYVMTVTLTHIGHKSRDDVFSNPEGLAVTNFSISEESR